MNLDMTLDSATAAISLGWRPMPGRCIIHLDPVPKMVGSLHVPDSARDRKIRDTAATGVVLAVVHKYKDYAFVSRPEHGDRFGPGDRVIVSLYDEDRDREVIITRNSVVLGVVEP